VCYFSIFSLFFYCTFIVFYCVYCVLLPYGVINDDQTMIIAVSFFVMGIYRLAVSIVQQKSIFPVIVAVG